MKRIAAGDNRPASRFLSLRNANIIDPTTAWAAIFFPSMNSVCPLSGLGRALQSRMGSKRNEISDHPAFPAKWAP